MSLSKFKKFVVVNADTFAKIKSLSIPNSHLSLTERKMLSILRNNKLTVNQRIKFYQQLLYQKLRSDQQSKRNTSEKSTQNDMQIPLSLENEASTSSRDVDVSNMSVDGTGEEDLIEEYKEETPEKRPVNRRLIAPFASMATPRRTLPNYKRSRSEAEFDASVLDESILSANTKWDDIFPSTSRQQQQQQQPPPLPINLPDDDSDMDVEMEKEEFMNEVRRQSRGPVDFRDLQFRNLENPNKEIVTVENALTGDVFPVQKSAKLLKQQRKKQKQDIDLMDPKNITPLKNRSGLIRPSRWDTFEEFD